MRLISVAMLRVRTHRYLEPEALAQGLHELSKEQVGPRGVLFVALDASGQIHLAVTANRELDEEIRVGDKLLCDPPWPGQSYRQFGAIHALPDRRFLFAGDSRLTCRRAADTARVIATWLENLGERSLYLGRVAHESGSWLASTDRIEPLHSQRLLDPVVTHAGVLARGRDEPTLYQLTFEAMAAPAADSCCSWEAVYHSRRGNIVMLEGRVHNRRLVVSCERGLVELDVSGLPDHVCQMASVQLGRSADEGFGVLGRWSDGAFAVVRGRVRPWGLEGESRPFLVGSPAKTVVRQVHERHAGATR